MANKEKLLNSNLTVPSEVRSLAFLVRLAMLKRILIPVADRYSTNTRTFIISKKVNGIVKANRNSLKKPL